MSKKRIILIAILSLIILALSTFLGFLITKENVELEKEKVTVIFNFEDKLEKEKEIEVNEEFVPSKLTVTVDEEDKSDLILVDTSNLDLTKLGEYIVKYYIIHNDKKYEEIQIIKVVDNTKPDITLEGKNIIILLNEEYKEPGYKATDNYDGDITDKVKIINEVDNKKVGTYKITYKVSDSSDNEIDVTREVTVKKPNVVVVAPKEEVKVEVPKVVVTEHRNTIKKNKFTNSTIYLEGYISSLEEENKLKIVGEETYEFPLEVNNNNYSVSIDPSNISNGTYKLYINEETLLNKMAMIERLARAKVGNKLVTFKYNESDEGTIELTDHAYQYDILINPGHGGSDTGAVNEYIAEKDLNLTISMYEKCRYEQHGLRVYMTRTNDVYGDKMGPDGLVRLHKIAYEMGYYGAVSKIVYSNHHNSIGNNYYSGYEILLAGELSKSEYQTELNIASKWNNIFDLKENHTRIYARDYDTERIYSKLNGEVYSFKNNYAVNRIPYAIFNVKAVIFEDAYMSNKEEFNWYYTNGNWINVSEAKIEGYLNSLGITYNSDNTSCK